MGATALLGVAGLVACLAITQPDRESSTAASPGQESPTVTDPSPVEPAEPPVTGPSMTARAIYGSPNPSNLPTGGITEQMAIDIAMEGEEQHKDLAWAWPVRDWPGAGIVDRWVWLVHWGYSAGPTSGKWCDIVVDFFSGEILHRSCIYS